MRGTAVYFTIGLLSIPTLIFAACTKQGSTVVYANGILTTYDQAYDDLHNLQRRFEDALGLNTSVNFTNGYNPSHLAGAGDLIESAAQLFSSSVSNYDLNTILLQIYPEITTQKILFVGHSQGTFYANELYNYLLAHGETNGAVGVYNVATPASSVAGYATVPNEGAYLTSMNDKVINAVRDVAQNAGAAQPLPANIAIPLSPQEAANQFGGHSFSGVYLANAAPRIVFEIEGALGKLTAADSTSSSQADVSATDAGCFTPPPRNFSYYAQRLTFAVADPVAGGVVASGRVIIAAGESAYVAVAAATQAVNLAFASAKKMLTGTVIITAQGTIASIGNYLSSIFVDTGNGNPHVPPASTSTAPIAVIRVSPPQAPPPSTKPPLPPTANATSTPSR